MRRLLLGMAILVTLASFSADALAGTAARQPLGLKIRWIDAGGLTGDGRLKIRVAVSQPARVSLRITLRSCGLTSAGQLAAPAAVRRIREGTHVAFLVAPGARRALARGTAVLELAATARSIAAPYTSRKLRFRFAIRSSDSQTKSSATMAPVPKNILPTCAAASSNPYRGKVGMGAHMLREREQDVQAQLHRLRAGGVDWIREDFSWLQIEPRRDLFDWEASDRFMAAAAVEGMSVLAIADYSAPWASSDPTGQGDQMYPPKDVGDYARFVGALAKRYGADGTFWKLNPGLPAKPLAAIELWNEPYGYWFWKSVPDPRAYADLVEAASHAVRAVDPGIQLLASGDLIAVYGPDSATQWRDWLTELLAADPAITDAIDAWSVHPYPSPWNIGPYGRSWSARLSFGRVEQIHDILVARSADKPIWITEVGWSTATGTPDGVSVQTQEQYLDGAVKRALDDWGAFVSHIFLFSWDRSSGNLSDLETNYGLRRPDGSTSPAWQSLSAMLTA